MADNIKNEEEHSNADAQQTGEVQLERGTYEIIRNRLKGYADDLENRLAQLNGQRRDVFGSIPTELISTQRVTTSHNCTAQDIVPVGKTVVV